MTEHQEKVRINLILNYLLSVKTGNATLLKEINTVKKAEDKYLTVTVKASLHLCGARKQRLPLTFQV